MKGYDREALIDVLDKVHEAIDVQGWPEAERIAEALGWRDPHEMPDGKWLRARLDKVLR